MDFLKRLFGGAERGATGDSTGVYFYVQPDGCEEVVRVRIDRNNDLSLADDNSTFFVRKGVRGAKCRQPVELTVYFDSNRRVSNTEVLHGALVDEAQYAAWKAGQEAGQEQPPPDGGR